MTRTHHEDTKTPGCTKGFESGPTPLSEKHEQVAAGVVEAAFRVHKALGPGLLEGVYETCFCHELEKLDVVVEDLVICELKAVDVILPVFRAQLLTYLKLTGKRLGFLINFNVPLIKEGIARLIY